jgi:hypothetical protein
VDSKPITSGDILRQLKADLIGKDSYRGVTLTYSWLANQFGHIALGFIPTIILCLSLSGSFGKTGAAFRSPIIVSVTWLAFETYNFLGPLLTRKHSRSKVVFIAKSKYVFQPPWGNVAFDTFTDLAFFWLGAFMASLIYVYSPFSLIILLILIALLIYPVSYWYPTKMFLQIPEFPFQFRLSQWNVESIDDHSKKMILSFLIAPDTGKHILVFGSEKSGKTSLGVGIATELAIRHHTCIYLTAVKLFSLFFIENEITTQLWNWRTASVLIIDDINAGDPVKPDIISPDLFLDLVDKYTSQNELNRKTLAGKKIIWILGNDDNSRSKLLSWKSMLEKIGVDEKNISVVSLP